jgi:hypothetical protein
VTSTPTDEDYAELLGRRINDVMAELFATGETEFLGIGYRLRWEEPVNATQRIGFIDDHGEMIVLWEAANKDGEAGCPSSTDHKFEKSSMHPK